MSISVSPPPLQVPAEFGVDKVKSAFFNALLNTIYQLWSATYSLRSTATVKTTDATTTGLVNIEVPEGKTVMIQADIVARRTGGGSGSVGDSAWYNLRGAYKNISGTLTGIGTPSLTGGEDQAGWNVGFSTSGVAAVVVVLGAAGNDITWEGSFNVFTVGA